MAAIFLLLSILLYFTDVGKYSSRMAYMQHRLALMSFISVTIDYSFQLLSTRIFSRFPQLMFKRYANIFFIAVMSLLSINSSSWILAWILSDLLKGFSDEDRVDKDMRTTDGEAWMNILTRNLQVMTFISTFILLYYYLQ